MAKIWLHKVSLGMKFTGLLFILSACTVAAYARTPEDASRQTARQALLEMFFSKNSGTFVKHLPAATRTALESAGAMSTLQQYSLLAGQLQTQGKTFETFDTGSTLLTAGDPKAGTTFEVIVDNDSLSGDNDNIEVSFKASSSNQTHMPAPSFLPRMTFGMKMEAGVWKLNEILVTLRLPLADPAFLKGVTEAIKARAASATSMQTQGPNATASFGSDASVMAAMRTIIAGEQTYRQSYSAVGYTCTLSDLDGFGGGQPNEHQAMLIASGLASGKKFGYVFALSGCAGMPSESFNLVATPAGNSFGRHAYCSDQSGAVRSSSDGNGSTCLRSGTETK